MAVDGIDLDVSRSEIFGFLCPNGAGKTTTTRMLCGLLPPGGGTAEVGGMDVVHRLQPLRHRVGYMPHRFSLYPDLTAAENLRLSGGLYGVSEGPLERRVEWVPAMPGWV